ncbi:MAG TPA: hypothetical protein VIK74_06685, partial [Parasegetibacter sp.]
LMHSKQKDASADQFFNSFSLTTLKYRPAVLYYDTLLNFQVNTPVVPVLDEEIRALVEKSSSEEFLNGIPDYYSYYPRNRYAAFESDSTGESIYVTIHTFPKYYHAEDSASFWGQQLNLKRIGKNFIIKKNEFFRKSDSICGYRLELTDTNSTRIIHGMVMLRDNRLFTVMTLGDSTAEMSSFVKGFFESFQPLSRKTGPSVFQNKTNAFFNDYYSTDSLTRKRAKDAINYVHFGKEGLPKLLQAIKSLKYGDKDYFDNKTRFIAELGYIKDSTVVNQVLNELKAIHEASFDTSSFQNAAITAIANLNTEKSYKVLKELLLLEPPVFEDSEDYSELFENITDSLQLSRILLPELFQLASIDDYKELINSMLRDLVDSSLVSGADYDSYFPKLFFDARIEWKKQQVRDEKMLDKQVNDDDDQEAYMYGLSFGNKSSSSDLESYAVLLLPFYESNLQVQKYFERLLTSTDGGLQLFTVIRMLKQKLAVPDSIIKSVASKDEYRGRLLAELEEIGQTDKFPAEFRKQEDVARSMLLRGSRFQKFYAIELFDKIRLNHKNKTGYVYLFKYKLMKDDDWMIGISGLQPLDTRMVSGKGELVKLTGVHLNGPDPVSDQFMEQVKRLQFSKRRSAEYFFNSRY